MWWKRRWGMLGALQATAALATLPYLILPSWAGSSAPVAEGICVAAWIALATFSAVCAWRWPRRGFAGALWLSGLLVGVHTLVSPLQQMQVLNGLQLLVLGMIAAFALSRKHVDHWLMVVGGLYLVAVTINPAPLGIWLGPVIATTVVITTVVVCQLLERVREASTHDPLTGALNRKGLTLQAKVLRAMDVRRKASTSVAYLDLDGFKGYNDTLGHAAGDALLVDVVAHLRSALRTEDLIARVGGDEFVVVMAATGQSDAEDVMARACADLPIGCSCGVGNWAADVRLESALEQVDALMYEHKQEHYANIERHSLAS